MQTINVILPPTHPRAKLKTGLQSKRSEARNTIWTRPISTDAAFDVYDDELNCCHMWTDQVSSSGCCLSLRPPLRSRAFVTRVCVVVECVGAKILPFIIVTCVRRCCVPNGFANDANNVVGLISRRNERKPQNWQLGNLKKMAEDR